MNANGKIFSTLLFALIFSLPVGWLVASIYVTLANGGGMAGLAELDLLAFWYETPLYLGFVTRQFYWGLGLIGATSAVLLAVTAALAFRPKHFGTARWAGFGEMRRLKYLRPYRKISGPVFGKTKGPRTPGLYLTNGEQPHSLVVAPTRAGKGVGVVIPTLLTFDGSVLALDVKGELFELTSRARKKRGDRIFKFSPMDPDGLTHCYNPVLDIVRVPPERRFSEARRLANNLIAAKGKGSEGFIDGARDLFVAGVLACIERGNPTIGAVYDLYAQPGEKYKLFAQLAEESNIAEVTRIFDNMAGNDTKIITSYTSVLGDGGLNLWADPLIKNATSRSDFSIYDLRRDPTSIYLCVSPNDLEVIAPLVRLFFQQIVSILQRTMPGDDEVFEVLFLLDEFKHLGKLDAIETAVTTIAGYKGRFMFIIQSLSALTGAYEQAGKENFLSNAGVQVFMATADDETPEYISKAIGEYTFSNKTTSYNRKEFFDANIQKTDQGSPLLRPEQVRLLEDDMQIVLVKGQPPMKMHKVKYYADRYLKPLFEGQAGPLPQPDPIPLTAETTPPVMLKEQEEAGRRDDEEIIDDDDDFDAAIDDNESDEIAPTADAAQEDDTRRSRPADAALAQQRAAQFDQNIRNGAAADAAAQGAQSSAAANPATPQGGGGNSGVDSTTTENAETPAQAEQRKLLERIIALQQRQDGQSLEHS
ncbi:type IV secretion system ATPase VirD4 [Notoacmeibacter sp. MSK16QG-6]|uniref:type IV secretion system ATPase VirD4 n=1 Tax=Notoacmeibacter sp. MSK16QG-6 TaxID=2957982 RepID=UPI00209FB937|nr:type IV secretion system ATPase VirD4 [Notoacmeibacter sp. MSK16QG-6]MCP1200609.1 type IV secretion system ATPase VirD4 [Notoacmeibacter sp. MSK16QG-6]